jgi:adenylate kinase family enzyme
MSLIFVTGISGSGKSTVWQELKARGYEAYDVDEDALAKWHNNETGYVHPKSSVKAHQRTPAFLASHSWKVPRQEVEELAKHAVDKNIFLCGVVANEKELWDLFGKVIALTVDEDTLRHRIQSRTNNDFGKSEHEFEQIIGWQADTEDSYRKFGHITIDATRPLGQVVDDVIAVASSGDKDDQ